MRRSASRMKRITSAGMGSSDGGRSRSRGGIGCRVRRASQARISFGPRCRGRRSGGSRGRRSGRSASRGRGPSGAGSSRAGRGRGPCPRPRASRTRRSRRSVMPPFTPPPASHIVKPNGWCSRPSVPSAVGVRPNSPPQTTSVSFEQAARLQVGEQPGDRLVGRGAVVRAVRFAGRRAGPRAGNSTASTSACGRPARSARRARPAGGPSGTAGRRCRWPGRRCRTARCVAGVSPSTSNASGASRLHAEGQLERLAIRAASSVSSSRPSPVQLVELPQGVELPRAGSRRALARRQGWRSGLARFDDQRPLVRGRQEAGAPERRALRRLRGLTTTKPGRFWFSVPRP